MFILVRSGDEVSISDLTTIHLLYCGLFYLEGCTPKLAFPLKLVCKELMNHIIQTLSFI